jgi:tRNA threonylcarbamoyl adenosine modification protein YeaZ
MKILALEFSSPQRSVAVIDPGSGQSDLRSVEVIESGAGVTRGLTMIDEALKQAGMEREQIECVAIGLGPGSYTGVRAAIAIAQGWQLASGARQLNCLGLSSAHAVAAQAQVEGSAGRVDIVIDAQREEFYLAGYELGSGALREVEPLRIVSLATVCEREQAGALLIGPEVSRWFSRGRIVFPRAAALGRLAIGRNDFVSAEKLEPIYLRETKFIKAPPPRTVD